MGLNLNERLVKLFLSRISGPMRDAIIAGVKKLRKEAKKTPNIFDDIFVEVLCAILGIED